MDARVSQLNGRPMLVIDGQPTTEFWCYGWPNAIRHFDAAGLRICQFHVEGPSWWNGPGRYDFSRVEKQIDEFLAQAPRTLLIPRICFGYEGEGWWADAHPDQLAVGLDLDGKPVDYRQVRVKGIECWQSAASEMWTRAAAAATAGFVRHFELRNPENVLGYQIGACISVEWFRWWNFIPDTYEDYSAVAVAAFRAFLRRRYSDDSALRRAWGALGATLDTAEIPVPRRLHTPMRGFLRDANAERDVVDWLECFSELNAGQLIALCIAAKRATGGKKLVGSFYGYLWPHWNTQNPSRSGHLAIDRVLACPDIDYISAPYHYDHRGPGGAHESQSVPRSIELAGKLHLDEIDTFTHLTNTEIWWPEWAGRITPKNADETRRLFRRDAAATLGFGGSAWWMDLLHQKWYDDPALHAELRSLDALSRQTRDWTAESHAQVALVIDDRSYAYCDLQSNLNQYFTSLPRQFEWFNLGFPIEAVRLADLARFANAPPSAGSPSWPPYKLYVFLNAWHIDTATRATIRRLLDAPAADGSRPVAVWFYAAGYFGGEREGIAGIRDVTGIGVRETDGAVIPEIDVLSHGHELIDDAAMMRQGTHPTYAPLPEREGLGEGRNAGVGQPVPAGTAPLTLPSPPRGRGLVEATPRGDARFGARLSDARSKHTIQPNPRGWDTPMSPIFVVDDATATPLGRFVHNGEIGLAHSERDGRRSVYCGAPMLPGWLLRRIAAWAGVHLYADRGFTVRHRGPLASVYSTSDGRLTLLPPGGSSVTVLSESGGSWQSVGERREPIATHSETGESQFFLLS